MTPNQYWGSSDPSEYWAYRRSYTLKQEESFEDSNLNAWLQGLYNMRAVASVLGENVQYLEEPFDFKEQSRLDNMNEVDRLEEEIKKEEALIHAEFMRISNILNDNNKQKGGN